MFKINKNLAIANRSRVSCAHNADGIYDNPVKMSDNDKTGLIGLPYGETRGQSNL